MRFAWSPRSLTSFVVDRFVLEAGSRLLITGASGSGKSTLLALLCGLAAPTSGRITVLGTDLAELTKAGGDRFRAAHFGVIFQMFNLLPYLSVEDNVLLPLQFAPARRARAGGPAARGEARRLLTNLGLDGATGDHGPAARLSVGQQQRVAAARAVIGAPEIVLADEPTSALDHDHKMRFLELLFAELERTGASLVLVSHDPTLAALFDQVVPLAEIMRAKGARS